MQHISKLLPKSLKQNLDMWIFIFTLCFPLMVVFGEEDICEGSPFGHCSRPQKLLQDIRTPEDLREACPQYIDTVSCLGVYLQTCTGKSRTVVFRDNGEFESVRDLIADICDESTLLHKVFTKHIQCLRDGVFDDKNNTCYEKQPTLPEMDHQAVNEDISEYDLELSKEIIGACFSQLYQSSCYLEYVSNNCGLMTKIAAIEVIHRSYYISQHCYSEEATPLLKVLDEIEIEDALKMNLKELLLKLKKEDK